MKTNNSQVPLLQGTRSTWGFDCLLDNWRLLTREISVYFMGSIAVPLQLDVL